MTYSIQVGNVDLKCLTSVKIKKDVTKLTDTATIICPAVSHGRPLKFVKNIHKYDSVSIALGYDDNNYLEFEGFVKSTSIDDNELTIECEDMLYLFQRVSLPNKEMKDTTLKELLGYVLGEVNKFVKDEDLCDPISLNCLYSYGYSKFTFKNATAYTFMEQIQKEGAPNIYLRDGVLNIVPQYTNSDGIAKYSMQKNISKDGLKLKWREESDKCFYVEVKAKDKNGKEITASAGKQGESKMEIKFTSIKQQKSLQTIADNIYKGQVYTGYEGSFDAWLKPYCDANYTVELRDEANVLKNGKYYVTAVEIDFSSSGGKRTISLGASV